MAKEKDMSGFPEKIETRRDNDIVWFRFTDLDRYCDGCLNDIEYCCSAREWDIYQMSVKMNKVYGVPKDLITQFKEAVREVAIDDYSYLNSEDQ